MSAPSVVALTATHQRPAELARLGRSLAQIPSGISAWIVVDNAGDMATREAAEGTALRTHYLAVDRNLGCGGGLELAESRALELCPESTHLWILDDDTVVTPDALPILLGAMRDANAEAAHPLTVAADGSLGWFPGLLDREKFRAIRDRQTPEQFVQRCGPEPIPFSWSQGIALLVTRSILEVVGLHRNDYWVRGEDLEFSLRITHRHRGIYVPEARVEHLPPASEHGSTASEYAKHRAMLQNLAYTSLRLRHGHRLIRTLPGNWLRFARTWGWQSSIFKDLTITFWQGALQGRPAGADNARAFQA